MRRCVLNRDWFLGYEGYLKFEVGTASIDAAALGAVTLPMFQLLAAQTDLLIKQSQ